MVIYNAKYSINLFSFLLNLDIFLHGIVNEVEKLRIHILSFLQNLEKNRLQLYINIFFHTLIFQQLKKENKHYRLTLFQENSSKDKFEASLIGFKHFSKKFLSEVSRLKPISRTFSLDINEMNILFDAIVHKKKKYEFQATWTTRIHITKENSN